MFILICISDHPQAGRDGAAGGPGGLHALPGAGVLAAGPPPHAGSAETLDQPGGVNTVPSTASHDKDSNKRDPVMRRTRARLVDGF